MLFLLHCLVFAAGSRGSDEDDRDKGGCWQQWPSRDAMYVPFVLGYYFFFFLAVASAFRLLSLSLFLVVVVACLSDAKTAIVHVSNG